MPSDIAEGGSRLEGTGMMGDFGHGGAVTARRSSPPALSPEPGPRRGLRGARCTGRACNPKSEAAMGGHNAEPGLEPEPAWAMPRAAAGAHEGDAKP